MVKEQLENHREAGLSELAFLIVDLLQWGQPLVWAKHKAVFKISIFKESNLNSLEMESAVKQLETSTALCEVSTQQLFSSPASFTGVWRGWFCCEFYPSDYLGFD